MYMYCDADCIIDLFQWINPYTVVAMDTSERIHLISAKTDAEVEVCCYVISKDAAL